MPRKRVDFNDSELAVLEVLWELGRATIRQITDEIYTRRTSGEYATVQKQLERMEAKGYVKRDRRTFAHTFTAKVNRSALIGHSVQKLADKLCEGSLTPVLVHLVEAKRLSAGDREMLRRLIDESESHAT